MTTAENSNAAGSLINVYTHYLCQPEHAHCNKMRSYTKIIKGLCDYRLVLGFSGWRLHITKFSRAKPDERSLMCVRA